MTNLKHGMTTAETSEGYCQCCAELTITTLRRPEPEVDLEDASQSSGWLCDRCLEEGHELIQMDAFVYGICHPEGPPLGSAERVVFDQFVQSARGE